MSPDPIDRPDVRPDTGDQIITPDLVVPDVTDPSGVLPDTGGTPTFNLTDAEILLLKRLLGTADPATPRGAQTASGWPYALPADPLVEWPGVSQALANKLETLPRTAVGAIAGGIISAPTDFTITFPVGRFTVAPIVMLTWQEGQHGIAAVKTRTAANAVITCLPFSGSTIPRVQWFAIEERSP